MTGVLDRDLLSMMGVYVATVAAIMFLVLTLAAWCNWRKARNLSPWVADRSRTTFVRTRIAALALSALAVVVWIYALAR